MATQADSNFTTPNPGPNNERAPRESAFDIVFNLEDDLTRIGQLIDALFIVAEGVDEGRPKGALYAIGFGVEGHLSNVDKAHNRLWRLLHPKREQFEREGWPSDDEPNTEQRGDAS